MVLLSQVVERHQGELERLHGAQLLPGHRQALQAMRRCRRHVSPLVTNMELPTRSSSASTKRSFLGTRSWSARMRATQAGSLTRRIPRLVYPSGVIISR